MPPLYALLLGLLLLGPALGPGYVLAYDMVWVPDLTLRSDFLGLGSSVPRAVPSDAVVAVLDEVVPGMLLQKVTLAGALVLAGAGVARLVGGSLATRMVAVSIAVWSPFVVERLGMGHWPMLLGYGCVPWLVVAGRQLRDEGRLPRWTWLLLVTGSLSASAGVVSALVLVLSGATRSRRTWTVLLAGCLAANAPWLLAGLLHSGSSLQATGFDVFAARGEGSLPVPLAVASLGGIWNSEVVPQSRTGWLGWLGTSAVLVLAALGVRRWLRGVGVNEASRLGALWLIGVLIAGIGWTMPHVADSIGGTVPGWGLLRDGTRYLGLCLPLLVSLAAAGMTTLAAAARPAARPGLAVAVVLLPLATLPDAVWGLGGALTPVRYPGEYAEARAAIEDLRESSSGEVPAGDLVVLPFTSYRAPTWNGGRKTLDPLGRYLPLNYLASDDLVVSGRRVPGEDPRGQAVRRALAGNDPARRSRSLALLGVGMVARDRPASQDVALPGYDAEVSGVSVYQGAGLELTQLDGVEPRTPTVREVGVVTTGWLLFLGLLGWAVLRATETLVTGRRRGDHRWYRVSKGTRDF